MTLEPKIETIISNKTLSEHVMEFKKDVFQGLQYDTTLQLKGSVTVAGDTVGDFVAGLKKLIEDYRI